MLTHKEMIRTLTFQYHATVAANPDFDVSLDDYLRECGIPDRYMIIMFQSAWDYWTKHLCPVPDPEDDDDCYGFFDMWIDWFVGDKCLEGDDIGYMYAYNAEVAARLDEMGIAYDATED